MTDLLVPLLLFLLPLAYSPGPGNLALAANGARFGFRATLPASAGYHLATWVVTATAGYGVMGLIDGMPWLFVILKTAGATYVFWLAWKLLHAGLSGAARAASPIGFRDGALLLLLNPKAYMIIGLMFAQFLGPEPDIPTILAITSVFTLNNLIAFSLWTVAGGRLLSTFRNGASARMVNTVFGVMLALVAAWMAL